jgi:hypothetical protein
MAQRFATVLTSLSIDLPVVDEDDAVSYCEGRRINLLRERLDLEVEGAGRRLEAADVEDCHPTMCCCACRRGDQIIQSRPRVRTCHGIQDQQKAAA